MECRENYPVNLPKCSDEIERDRKYDAIARLLMFLRTAKELFIITITITITELYYNILYAVIANIPLPLFHVDSINTTIIFIIIILYIIWINTNDRLPNSIIIIS